MQYFVVVAALLGAEIAMVGSGKRGAAPFLLKACVGSCDCTHGFALLVTTASNNMTCVSFETIVMPLG